MTRTTLILMLTAALAAGLSAQETTTATETAGTTTTVAAEAPATTTTAAADAPDAATNVKSGEETAGETTSETAAATTTGEKTRTPNVYEVRNQFTTLLSEHHPHELGMILKLDPNLLGNRQFLASWPQLAQFLAEHPEVAANARFYLGNIPYPGTNGSVVDEIFEAIVFGLAWVLAIFALGWLIRTIVEQKRWNKLSQSQAEVHNKILDRFSSSEELLQYVKTPAGARFLEGAPIQVQAEPPSGSASTVSAAPLTRIVWSAQLGVVAAVAGLGLLLVSLRFDERTSQGLFVIGGIVFCVGAGFIASAVVSLTLSRRLGLWQGPPAPNDGGTVR